LTFDLSNGKDRAFQPGITIAMDGKSDLAELTRRIDERGKRVEFAEKVGISESYLSNILSGNAPLDRIPVGTVKKICEQVGMSIDALAYPERAAPKRQAARR
jgi:transcriptional regulator with XRE-family HTH domain